LIYRYRCNHRTGEWRHFTRQGKPLPVGLGHTPLTCSSGESSDQRPIYTIDRSNVTCVTAKRTSTDTATQILPPSSYPAQHTPRWLIPEKGRFSAADGTYDAGEGTAVEGQVDVGERNVTRVGGGVQQRGKGCWWWVVGGDAPRPDGRASPTAPSTLWESTVSSGSSSHRMVRHYTAPDQKIDRRYVLKKIRRCVLLMWRGKSGERGGR